LVQKTRTVRTDCKADCKAQLLEQIRQDNAPPGEAEKMVEINSYAGLPDQRKALRVLSKYHWKRWAKYDLDRAKFRADT
jgi:hypothetical protein